MAKSKAFLSLLLGLVWICDGIVINLLQLILRLTVRPFNPDLFRKLNYYLIYTSWSQLVAIAEHWSSCRVTIHYANEDSRRYFGHEHALTVMNHRYEVDWLYCWMVMDKFGCLASSKSFTKKSLRFVPVIGWSFYFAELIFLARDWDRDQLILADSLDNLMLYKQYINLLLFAEGTRFTKAKYEAGVQFAHERNLQVLKHHLIPRTRGFRFTVRHMRKFIGAVYNIQIEFDENSPCDMSALLEGKPMHGHMFVERIPIDQVPMGSEQEIDDFLFNMYKRKDELSEHYRTEKTFPSVSQITPKPRWAPFFNLVGWTSLTVFSQLLFVYTLYQWQMYSFLLTIISLCLIAAAGMLYFILESGNTQKGSSYGMRKSEKTASNTSLQNAN